MEWAKIYDEIKPYVFRIESELGYGTGFLLGFNKTHTVAAIATAAHVIKEANDWEKPIKLVHSESNETEFLSNNDRAIWLNDSQDAATIFVNTKDYFPKKPLSLFDSTKYMRIGIEIGWVGFPRIAPHYLCFFSGKVSYFIEKDNSYLIDGVAINGVSGGPVFYKTKDGSPEIIGIVSAYIPNKQVGDTLPGLLMARDITPFHDHLKTIKSIDEAKEKEMETQKQTEKEMQKGEHSKGSEATQNEEASDVSSTNSNI
ncbi:MAG: serine protease [Candidatus Margulisiibacteriota bacterium]